MYLHGEFFLGGVVTSFPTSNNRRLEERTLNKFVCFRRILRLDVPVPVKVARCHRAASANQVTNGMLTRDAPTPSKHTRVHLVYDDLASGSLLTSFLYLAPCVLCLLVGFSEGVPPDPSLALPEETSRHTNDRLLLLG